MDFIVYTPSFLEPNTYQAHLDHFHPACSTSTSLPPKPPNPLHPLSFSCLSAHSNFINPPLYPSVPLHTQPVHNASLKTHILPNRLPSSASPCIFKDSHKGQNQEQAVQLNNFNTAFTENEYTEGLIESRINVDLTLGEDSRQHLHDAGRNPKGASGSVVSAFSLLLFLGH